MDREAVERGRARAPAVLAAFWIASEGVVVGAIGLAVALALVARTYTRPCGGCCSCAAIAG